MSVTRDVAQAEMLPCTPLALVASAVHSATALCSSSFVVKTLMLRLPLVTATNRHPNLDPSASI